MFVYVFFVRDPSNVIQNPIPRPGSKISLCFLKSSSFFSIDFLCLLDQSRLNVIVNCCAFADVTQDKQWQFYLYNCNSGEITELVDMILVGFECLSYLLLVFHAGYITIYFSLL